MKGADILALTWIKSIVAACQLAATTSCAFFQVHTLEPTSNPVFMLGVLVFAFGELLNGYHHRLLARLRASGVCTYGGPRGGLFGWVASPHYLGEILNFVLSDLLPVWGKGDGRKRAQWGWARVTVDTKYLHNPPNEIRQPPRMIPAE